MFAIVHGLYALEQHAGKKCIISGMCKSQMKNNSYERAHSARHNFQIMLLLLSITRHLWLGEPKWKYGLGTQSSSSCQMQVVCFLDFFLESKSCIPALGFCAGVRHLMQFRELQGKNLPTETFQYVLLSKSENLGSNWRNHKPQSGWDAPLAVEWSQELALS